MNDKLNRINVPKATFDYIQSLESEIGRLEGKVWELESANHELAKFIKDLTKDELSPLAQDILRKYESGVLP